MFSPAAYTPPYGLTSPAQSFAMKVQRFMHAFGVRQEALRAIALASCHHAQANSRAVMHGRPLDEAKYDASRWIVEPFHLYDCCLENDGAAAMIVVPAECAKDFDHISHGATGLLADNDEQGRIHNGADGNAPGTAVVLHLAERLPKRETRRRGIVFALWSGEKLGLVGSSRFVADPLHYLGMMHIAAFATALATDLANCEERPDPVREKNTGSG